MLLTPQLLYKNTGDHYDVCRFFQTIVWQWLWFDLRWFKISDKISWILATLCELNHGAYGKFVHKGPVSALNMLCVFGACRTRSYRAHQWFRATGCLKGRCMEGANHTLDTGLLYERYGVSKTQAIPLFVQQTVQDSNRENKKPHITAPMWGRAMERLLLVPRGKWLWYIEGALYQGAISLQWRHNGRDGVSNHQPHDCLCNRLFRHRSKKTSKLRVSGLCAGNSSGTGEIPAQMASNTENGSVWWRHHVDCVGIFSVEIRETYDYLIFTNEMSIYD